MSKKKTKMYNVNHNQPKDKNIMKINVREIQMHLPGLCRNDGIVKTGTGKWEDKRKKDINKRHKKEISRYDKSNLDIYFFVININSLKMFSFYTCL